MYPILCEAETASHNQIYGADAAPFMRIQNRDSHKLYYAKQKRAQDRERRKT